MLRGWANAAQAPPTLVRRAKILLLAAEGMANSEIAERLEVSRPTVITWRKRYVREGLTGQLIALGHLECEGLPSREVPCGW